MGKQSKAHGHIEAAVSERKAQQISANEPAPRVLEPGRDQLAARLRASVYDNVVTHPNHLRGQLGVPSSDVDDPNRTGTNRQCLEREGGLPLQEPFTDRTRKAICVLRRR